MVSLTWRCMKCVMRLVGFIALPWHPSTGHVITWDILGKDTRCVILVAFVGSTRVVQILDLSHCDLQWAARYPSVSFATHYEYYTRCHYFGPTLIPFKFISWFIFEDFCFSSLTNLCWLKITGEKSVLKTNYFGSHVGIFRNQLLIIGMLFILVQKSSWKKFDLSKLFPIIHF